jgi:hypothetical protein
MINAITNHEFEHLFAAVERSAYFMDCDWEREASGEWIEVGACTPVYDSWAALSWKTSTVHKYADSFPLSLKTCYYECRGKFLEPAMAGSLVQQWWESNFATIYGAWNPAEDFAEVFEQFVKFEHSDAQQSIEAGGKIYDIREHYFSPQMREKRNYMHRMFYGDLGYPNPMSEFKKVPPLP